MQSGFTAYDIASSYFHPDVCEVLDQFLALGISMGVEETTITQNTESTADRDSSDRNQKVQCNYSGHFGTWLIDLEGCLRY